MDYEKAYKEALERAKSFQEKYGGDYAGYIFPELRESEDERIRKGLISLIEKSRHHPADKARWLSYLEKQKEQKPAWSEDYLEEDIQTRFAFYTYKDEPSTLYLSNVFVEETSRNKGFGTKIIMAAEKVAETIGATTIRLKAKQDSPANVWYRKHGYDYMTSEDGYDWLEKNLKYLKPKKSIKWNGDDELMIESLIAYLKGTGQDFISNDMVYWLKSLPERFNLQPKQEWSDEDKRILKGIIGLIDHDQHYGVSNKEMLDWLKSLRPQGSKDSLQTHWKPSEEQMKALQNAVALADGNKVLAGLYEQLKAIKEDEK